jgi:hypothetical protein
VSRGVQDQLALGGGVILGGGAGVTVGLGRFWLGGSKHALSVVYRGTVGPVTFSPSPAVSY